MPLIARVMDRARTRILRTRSHRGDHRPRQLHRLAGRHRGRARHRAGGRQAGRRRSRRWRPSRRHIAADDTTCRGRRSMRGTAMSICRSSGPAAARWCRRGSCRSREALHAAASAARRVWSAPAAKMLAAAWPAGRAPAERSRRTRAPDIDWVARLGAAALDTGVAAEAALSARARRAAAERGATGAPMIGFLQQPVRARRTGAVGSDRARCRSDRGAARRVVSARLERTRGRSAADRPQRDRASRADRATRSPASSCRGRPRTKRRSCRSRSIPAQRGRGLARSLLTLHLRRLAGLGARSGVSRSRRGQSVGAAAL